MDKLKYFFSNILNPKFLLLAYLIKTLIIQAGPSDAAIMLGLIALHGLNIYFNNNKQPEINQQIANEIEKVKSAINVIKMERITPKASGDVKKTRLF